MILILAMCAFSLSMSITPGPVNFISLSSGGNFGFKKTLPFVTGATFGFTILLTAVGLGLGSLTSGNTYLFMVLEYIGCGFIGYLGFRIFTTCENLTASEKESAKPTITQGVLLQWLNPKAWMACVAGTTAFNVADSKETLVLFTCIYFVICYAGIACWALIGDKISNWLSSAQNMLLFNRGMGIMLFTVALYLMVM